MKISKELRQSLMFMSFSIVLAWITKCISDNMDGNNDVIVSGIMAGLASLACAIASILILFDIIRHK